MLLRGCAGGFRRNRALTRGRPVGAKGVGLSGGDEGIEDVERARSEDVATGAQSGSEASASASSVVARCERRPPWHSEDTHSLNRGVVPLR